MARRRKAQKRHIPRDLKYDDALLASFVNCMMRDGKKSVAERIVYEALDRVAEKKAGAPPLTVFHEAIHNVMPTLEVYSRRVGGATYQVPMEVRKSRRQTLAIRWLLQAARTRPGHSMRQRLCDEILDAADNRGGAIKKRTDTHRTAEANRAFSHYRW